jgi:hypothetical protein
MASQTTLGGQMGLPEQTIVQFVKKTKESSEGRDCTTVAALCMHVFTLSAS